MRRSHRWADRCLETFTATNPGTQALYGIVQGGIYPDLRAEGGEFVASRPFFGQAIGGSLGASKAQMHDVVAMAAEHLNPARPTHLLGIGGIQDIWNGVTAGIDTFDCVHPTRLARHGGALINPSDHDASESTPAREHINLSKACFRDDPRPIDATCPCRTCQTLSRAYLHHLFRAKEMLGPIALTLHNVTFMNLLMARVRHQIHTHAV